MTKPAGLQILQAGRKVKKVTPEIASMGRPRKASFAE
jgi:hypothetical protein